MTELIPLKPDKSDRSDKPDKEKPTDPGEKALRKLEAERGLLLPSDKYRALVNAVKAAQDLIELADKKARFALVIMSVLNAVAILLVVRGGDVAFPKTGMLSWLVPFELITYAVITVYYIAQAISALRPRGVKPPPLSELPTQVEPAVSMRVLFYADVIARERNAYQRLWADLRMDNLITELADQLFVLSMINRQKYSALDRLYFGLTVMTVMLTIVIASIGLARVSG